MSKEKKLIELDVVIASVKNHLEFLQDKLKQAQDEYDQTKKYCFALQTKLEKLESE